MADRRSALIPLLIIGFIFFSPNANQSAARLEQRPTIQDVIAEEERSLEVLQNSSYGDINSPYGHVLNLTGLEPGRGYAWDALPKAKERAVEQLQYALGDAGRSVLEDGGRLSDLPPLYGNVTGFVRGKWARSKLQESIPRPQLNISTYAPEGPFGKLDIGSFGRNITGDEGEVRFRFHERTPYELGSGSATANVTGISAELTLQDATSGEERELQMYGFYDLRLGQVIMTTTSSDKMAGIFMLPQFALSKHTFEGARALLNESISRTIEGQRAGRLLTLNPWPSAVDGAVSSTLEPPNCEIIMYLQQLPPSGLPSRTPASASKILTFMERELRFPTGAFLPSAPEMRFSMLAFSPDCGYVLESKGEPDFVPQGGNHLTGPKMEVLYTNGRHHLLVFTFIIGAQIALLMRQMREASTPSTRSRISFYTIGMLALGDGFATMSFLLISLFVTGVWLNLVATAFLAFVSVSFFGMRFLMDIWTAQAPERARQAREEAEEERQRLERMQVVLERLRAERLARLAAAQAPSAPPEQQDVSIPSADADVTQPVAVQPETEISSEQRDNEPPPVDVSAPPNPQSQPETMPGSLPLPVTAQRPTDTGATPIFMPSDQEGLVGEPTTGTQIVVDPAQFGTSFGALYTRFYLLLLMTLFVSLNAASWPSTARRVYFTMLAMFYLSFWVPQIFRNLQRNCRRALRWDFVLGQSAVRLVPFGYFYLYKYNVLFAERDVYSMTILVLWLWMQILLLVSQELVGPRWFVHKGWAPEAYDYHPVLREDEEGAAMPIGFAEAKSGSAPTSPLLERRASLSSPAARRGSIAKEAKGKGKRVFDCAICFQELEVPVIEAGGSSDATLAGGLLARRNYMVTPCRHIFHSACLEGWMKYRLQCPICREDLPAH